MASVCEEASPHRRPSPMPGAGDTDDSPSHSMIDSGVFGKGREADTAPSAREGSIRVGGASVITSSRRPPVPIDSGDSANDKGRHADSERRESSGGGAGVLRLDPPPGDSLSEEQRLWRNVERIMVAKRSHVQQVLEDFGISDVQPSALQLEEQVWRVVQGELTLQEAADLV